MSEQRLRASLVGKAFPGHTTVHAVRGAERLGELYRYEVDVSADEVAFSQATGSTVLVTLTDDDEQERFVGGEIEALEVSPTDDEGATSVRCRLTVVPRAAVLSRRHGFRIHQDLDVPDIVRRVLRDAGVPEEETRWDSGATTRSGNTACSMTRASSPSCGGCWRRRGSGSPSSTPPTGW